MKVIVISYHNFWCKIKVWTSQIVYCEEREDLKSGLENYNLKLQIQKIFFDECKNVYIIKEPNKSK